MKDENSELNNEMPTAPDLSQLFAEQSEKLKAAQLAAKAAFDVFQARDVAVQELSKSYDEEVLKVLLIAKAATTPQLAAAAIPVVLAAANKAFAQAPLTDIATKSAIEAAFQAVRD